MPEIVFDIETVGDIRFLDTLKVTMVSLYDFGTNTTTSFEEHELGQLWPLFEKADRLIGYNSEHFDLPILSKYYTGDLFGFPHLDMMKVVKESTGKRFKLDDLAKATLQTQKSADGLQAMKWFEEGKIDEIKKYCEQDVRITKELYEYGRKNKMLYFPTLTGTIQPFAVNFDPPAQSANLKAVANGGVNLTLPL